MEASLPGAGGSTDISRLGRVSGRSIELHSIYSTGCVRRYVRRPDGLPVTNDFVTSGKYEIEVMGDRIPAVAHLKSPFDPAGKRVHGNYDD
jgi:hypothetical protein